jgi:hypothetical protein
MSSGAVPHKVFFCATTMWRKQVQTVYIQHFHSPTASGWKKSTPSPKWAGTGTGMYMIPERRGKGGRDGRGQGARRRRQGTALRGAPLGAKRERERERERERLCLCLCDTMVLHMNAVINPVAKVCRAWGRGSGGSWGARGLWSGPGHEGTRASAS